MPVERYALEYNMNHLHRGVAVIFNNETFDMPNLKARTGTNVDCENLKSTLTKLKFDVRVYKDPTLTDIRHAVTILSEMDHTNSDCLFIAILSHGEQGCIFSRDTSYKLDSIWQNFTSDKVPSLAGKPKLFFVQACQGDQLDAGTTLEKFQTDSSTNATSYKIPSYADFLIAYSTIPGFYSWRNTTRGSWFMQALCSTVDIHHKSKDLLTMLTFALQRVALDFESNTPDYPTMHQQKQIPCFTSMLTRLLYFR